MELKGPQFTESTHNKLILTPKLNQEEYYKDYSSTCSCDSESESDSSSDEDLVGEFIGENLDKGMKTVQFEKKSET